MSQRSRYLPLSLGLLCSGALALAALTARSQTPATSALTARSQTPATSASAAASAYPSAAPSAAPSASASASGSASAEAAKKNVLRAADIPTETSEAPKDKKDWDPAKVVSENKGSTVCVFKVLREWLRIECESRVGGALVVGEPADVKVWAWGNPFAAVENADPKLVGPPPMTVIVMPLRRGDAKIFALMGVGEGWDWVGPVSRERLSIAWRETGDPVIIAGE